MRNSTCVVNYNQRGIWYTEVPQILSRESEVGDMTKRYWVLEWDRYFLSNPFVSIYDITAIVIGRYYFANNGANGFYLYRATTDNPNRDVHATGTDAHVYCFKSKRDAQMFMQGINFANNNAFGFDADTDENTIFQIRPLSGYTGKPDQPFATHLYRLLDSKQLEAVLASNIFTISTTNEGQIEAFDAMNYLRSGYKGRLKNSTAQEKFDYEIYYTEIGCY